MGGGRQIDEDLAFFGKFLRKIPTRGGAKGPTSPRSVRYTTPSTTQPSSPTITFLTGDSYNLLSSSHTHSLSLSLTVSFAESADLCGLGVNFEFSKWAYSKENLKSKRDMFLQFVL